MPRYTEYSGRWFEWSMRTLAPDPFYECRGRRRNVVLENAARIAAKDIAVRTLRKKGYEPDDNEFDDPEKAKRRFAMLRRFDQERDRIKYWTKGVDHLIRLLNSGVPGQPYGKTSDEETPGES